MSELANAHDSGDCGEGCAHPEHFLDGVAVDLGLVFPSVQFDHMVVADEIEKVMF